MRRTSMLLAAALLAACSGEAEIQIGGAGANGPRPAFRMGKADAAAPAEETIVGDSVTTTDGAHDVLLPVSRLMRPGTTLARFGVGIGESQLGLVPPAATDDAGDGEGPRAIGVDGQGRVFLLDSSNDRVLRLAGNGQIEARFPLTEGTYGLSLGVGEDGSFAVLATREGFQEITYYDATGAKVAALDVAEAITPVTALFVDAEEKSVLVEHDELRVYTVIAAGEPLSQVDQAVMTLWGAPTLGGSLGGALVGDRTAVVRRYDADGVVEVEASLQADEAVAAMPLLRGLPDGRVVVVLLLETDAGPRYQALRLTSELQLERSVSFAPAVLYGLDEDLAVSPGGKLYQLKVTAEGVDVAVHFAD